MKARRKSRAIAQAPINRNLVGAGLDWQIGVRRRFRGETMLRILLVCAFAALLTPALAQQPGSAGGSIGKHGKSASGGEEEKPAAKPKPRRASAEGEAPRRKAAGCGRIAGTWHWVWGTTTIIKADGTASNNNGAYTSSWTCKGNTYTFIWSNGFRDTATLSDDGGSMSIVNNIGFSFGATRF